MNPQGPAGEPSAPSARSKAESHEAPDTGLLEQMLERESLRTALKRIEKKGFSFFRRKGETLIRVAPKRLRQVAADIREITARRRGVSLGNLINALNEKLQGWVDYFALADTHTPFQQLDEWLRRPHNYIRPWATPSGLPKT